MTGNVAIDVVIGLVFIYLLYSLLASIINEIIATYLRLRASNLRSAIVRMLEDDKPSIWIMLKTYFSHKAQNPDATEVKSKRHLSKEFYNKPSIKYLAKKGKQPSYISADVFSKTILDLLKDKGEGESKLEKIKNSLDLKDYIDSETRKHIKSLLEDAQNDLIKFKLLLEDWFNNTMDRAVGWYKRKTQLILLLIGLALAMFFNVNTFEIVHILSKDKDTRDQMVELASSYVIDNKELIEKFKTNSTLLNTNDTVQALKDFNAQLDSLLTIRDNLKADAEEANHVMGFQPSDSLPVDIWLTISKDSSKFDSLKQKLTKKQKYIVRRDTAYFISFKNDYLAQKTAAYYNIAVKGDCRPVFYASFNRIRFIKDNFLGYLITALAISLGAPFWFDLLNRLMQLKSSVSQKQTVSQQVQNNSTNYPKNLKG